MKTDHAHVEAASLSLLIIGLIAVVDYFVNIADGHPIKPFGYIALSFIVYLLARHFFKKLWQ